MACLVAAVPALAGPGSGTASISPPGSVQAGTNGKWTIVYTAAETITDGAVRVTVPSGWSAPQNSSSTSEAFVTIATNEPTGSPLLAVGGQVVTIDVDTLTAGNTLTLVYGDDAGGASARATAATTTGAHVFLVASDPAGASPVPIATSPQLTVVAGPASSLDPVPNDTTMTAGGFAPYRIVVRDADGNRTPVPVSRTVGLFSSHGSYYSPANHSTPITSIVISSGESSVRVDYRATLATSGTPHSLTMLTTSGSPVLGGVATASVLPGPLSTTISTLTATSPVTANGTSQSIVTVTSKDAFANPRAGDTVVLAVTGNANKADPGSATGADGRAIGSVTNTTAQPVTVSATINAQALTPTASITFQAGPVSAAASIVDATSPVTANGTSTSTVTVTARDANNNPISGQSVTLSVIPAAGATLTQPGGVTDASGQATGTLASAAIGTRTVKAVIGATAVTDSALVSFAPGAVASFQWLVDGNAVAGTFEFATLTALDAQGHVVTNYTGTVNLSTTSGGVGDGVVEWGAPEAQGTIVNLPGDDATYTFAAGDNGAAILRVTDIRAESFQLIATAGPATKTSDPINVASNVADKVELVAGAGQSATVNTPVAVLPKVRVRDAFDNLVAGATVTFRAVGGGGSVDVVAGGLVDSTGVTISDGTIDCDVWRLGTIVGINRLRALIASGSIPSVDFTATGTAGQGANLVITPGSKSVTVSSFEVVTATLTDSFGNVKSGERVDLFIKDAPDGSLVSNPADPNPTTTINATARWGNSDANGRITVRYSAPPGAAMADVLDGFTANVTQSSVADVTYTTTASGATNLRITFVGSSTKPAGQSVQFLVEAVDGTGNVDTGNTATVNLTPEAGSGLQFSLTDFGATVTQVTLASGARTVYTRGTLAGNWDVTTSGGGLGADTEPVVVTDTGVIDHYSVATVASVVAGATFNVSIEARDLYNNRVVGASGGVTLAAIDDINPGPAQSTLLVTGATLAAGQATVGESYTRAEPIRVKVSDAGSKEGTSGIVTVAAAAAKRIAKVSGDATGVAAGTARVLTAQVLDAYDNPVAGEMVSFVRVLGNGSVLPASIASNGSGTSATTLTTDVVAGDNRVRATILDAVPPSDELVEFSVQTVAGGIAYFTVLPQKTALVAGETVPLTVTAYDGGNNVVSQDNSTSVTLSSTGNAQFGAATGVLSGGVFATTVRDTVVQSFTITAEKTGGGPPSGTSAIVTVSNAGTYRVVKISSDGSGITVGTTRPLEVEVRDLYGNPVPGALATFSVASAPDGTPSFTDTDGDPNDGIVVTNGSGRGLVTYHTALTAGTNQVNAQILDGSPLARERVTFTVTTVAGGIAYYTVTMNATSTTAGVSKNATVTAYDLNDNPVDDDVTQVTLSGDPGTGLAFGTNPLTLSNGVAVTTVTATQVQTYRVRASTLGNPSVTGLGDVVTVVPAAPAGAITASATRTTITANGTSTTTITSGVIRDAFANQVAVGLSVNVSANIGGVIVGGSPKTIAPDGRITFDLRSSTTVGVSTVTMTSATGTASGTIDITFAPPPALACNTPPTPAIVVPGSSVSFSVVVQNTSPTAVNLTTATAFSFTDGTHTYSANLAAPQVVPGSGSVALVFASASIHAAFVTAQYAPTATLIGTDANTAPVNVVCTLPALSLLVTNIEITGIVPATGQVSRGQATTIAVTVKNNGAQSTTIDDVDLTFIPAGLFTVGNAPELGLALGPNASGVFNLPVTVQAGATLGPYDIDAAATGTVGGQSVVDPAVAPHPRASIQVVAAANLAYEPGTLTPVVTSRGKTYAFQTTIRNTGGGLAFLDSATTRLTFTDGVRTFSAAPVQNYAIAGGGAIQAMTFRPRAVPGTFTLGSYPVSLNAMGTENGAPFSQSVPLTGSPVSVVTPASLASAPGDALEPDQVSKTATVAFSVQLVNSGGATVNLTPATTTIRFAANAFVAALNPSGPTALPPGTTTLLFLGTPVSGSIASGTYFPQVQLNGFENGLTFSQAITLADNVVVQDAPNIAILSMIPSQALFTQDQAKPIKVRMVVANNGGANVTFTAASMRFIHAGVDRTNQFVVSTPAAFSGGTLLTGSDVDTVVFNVSDNTGNATTVGNMTIEGALEVEDVNTSQPLFADTDLGGKGNLQIQTPAAVTFNAVIPSQPKVTQGMTKTFQVRAAVRNTGMSDVALTLAGPTSRLVFTPSAGWISIVRPALVGGGTVLSGGEVDTMVFDVETSGSVTGPTMVDVATAGVESNSARAVSGTSSGLGSVLVQSPGTIVVSSITPSRTTVTSGTSVPWTVAVTLTNTGQADVDLDLGAAVSAVFQDGTTQPAFIVPASLVGGGTLLSGGETDQLLIPLTTAGSYSSFGSKSITVDVDGTELNSGVARNGNDVGSVTVQQAPDVAYDSLLPGTVSRGTSVAFAVTVTNPVTPNGATLTLDRATSRLRFGSNQFNVGLTQASPVDVAAGAQVTLLFTSAVVGAGVPTVPQADAVLELHWTHNGATGTRTIAIPGQITVQNAPSLSIVSVRSSRATVTAQQGGPWTVTMVVRNTGGAPVDLDLDPAVTKLGLNVLGSGAPVTPEYTIQPPTALVFAGGTVLAGSAMDSLIFDMSQAGNTVGTILVNGFVRGIDQNSSDVLTDDTGDGGTGSFALQLPGALSVLSITTPQTTATVGQTAKSYAVKMAVRNTGGAAVDVSLNPATSFLTFPGTTGWAVNPATMPSGVTLTGGETDTLRFLVTTTGGPAGVATIGGTVTGTENNTGAIIGDNTDSGGTGSITLQTPAVLVVDSVTPSQSTVTEGTAFGWDATVALRNTGQTAARLTLPAGFTITVQDDGGSTAFVKPTDLEEGGIILDGGAAGTLVAHATNTGTFSSFGVKALNVSVAAVETNSTRAFVAPGAGSILVQAAPNLSLVSLEPDTVTSGSSVDFEVEVSNANPNAATVVFDRGTTRVHFAGAFSAFLALGSPDSIRGGETTTLLFEGKPISTSIALGPHDFIVELGYNANEIDLTESKTLSNGVRVQAAPQLFIQQIVASQPSVTAGQAADWTATMTVVNTGSAQIDLDLAPPQTLLTFISPNGQPDNSYVVNPPVMGSGDHILDPSETNTVVFTIAQTGTTIGNIVISGRVGGTDLNQVLPVSDDTFDGGRGSIAVQSAAAVAVVATHTSQAEVTAAQDSDWAVRVVLANTGGADVNLDLASAGIAFAGPQAGWTHGPATLLGGGNVLEGGSVDSLLFTITTTGTAAGTRRIDTTVPWTEANSQAIGSATTVASTGYGQIVVETPAVLRITTTTAAAPNPAEVNVGQAFDVVVQVRNTGQADARDVVVGMSTNGTSTIPPVSPILEVAAGQTVAYPLPVTASGTPVPSETFTTSLVSAVDENSAQSNLVTLTNPPIDATATVAIQTQAELDITGVHPSQAFVTQGQSNPWGIIVALQNTGQADVDLTPPVAGDIAFSIAGATKIDYVVQPPTKFGSGAPGWRLAGGAVDSLVYSVIVTGSDTGQVDIALGAQGSDRNDPTRALSDTGATTVRVQEVAGLAILSTVGFGTFNHANANRDTVNTSFAYEIHVTVQNSGEDVDSVLVSLAKDGSSSVAPASLRRQSIAVDASHAFVFRVTAPSAPAALETFTASILSGVVSHNSGQPVTPQPPVDNTHLVVTQRRAELVLSLTSSAVGGVVSPNQQFTVTGRVTNAGQASLGGAAEVTLTPAANFQVQEPLVQAFSAGAAIVWNVTAPAAPQAAADFTCAITTTPDDVNLAAPAFSSKPNDLESITVTTGGALTAPSLSATSPPGAVDDTVSVGQSFSLRAAVTATSTTDNVTATLALPGGYSVVGALVRNLGNGTGGVLSVTYNVIAPGLPAGAADVIVTFAGIDENSQNPVPSVADTVAVTVVPRASLSVSASVTAPPEAIDNAVGVGVPFTVTANVANAAGAAGVAAGGQLSIGLPPGYTLSGTETVAKPFAVGTPVAWEVKAALQPSGPDQIAVTISTVPADENSGLPAQVANGTANIAMVTEGAAVAVRNVSQSLGIDTRVVPAGATDVTLLGFEIAYNASDPSVSDAEIDTIAVTVIDKNGQPLSAASVAATLARLEIDLGGAQPYVVSNPSSNPVVVSLLGGGADRTIAPNASANAVVALDLDAQPREMEIRVAARSGGLVVRDPTSGQRLSVTDPQGQPLDGQITSQSLVVLSGNFQEYAHNYPNPFHAGSQDTRIAYFLDAPAGVSLKIYALTGDLVYEETIPSGDARAQAGPQETTWDGRNGQGEIVRNGVYVCVLNAGSNSAKFRIAVAK